MRAPRTLALSLVAVAVAGSLALGIAAPADAASLWPKGWNPKQFMINVLSSMLAQSGPNNPYKRAVISADQTFDHSFEALDEQWKLNVKTGGLQGQGVPDSYDDYVLQEQEYFQKNNMTSIPADVAHPNSKKYVRKLSAPATKFAQFAATPVGGAAAATGVIAAGYFGFQAGKGIASMMGISDSGLCKPSFADGGFVAFITGTDCSDVNAPGAGFTPNADVIGLAPGGDCGQSAGFISNANAANTVFGTPTCRTNGVYVNPRNTSDWVRDGWWTIQSVTQNADGSLSLTYSYNGPVRTPGVDIASARQTQPQGYCLTSTGKAGTAFVWGSALFVPYPGNFPGSPTTIKSTIPTGGTCQYGYAILLRNWTQSNAASTSTGWGLAYRTGQPMSTIQSTDPDRTLQCAVTGTDGQTYTQSTPAYKDSAGKVPPPQCPVLPDGVGVANTKIDKTGGAGPQTVYNEPATPAYTTWWQQYPECRDGACPLDLVRKSDGKSCFDSVAEAALCVDWMKDPNKSTNYQCTYGVHNVDVSECFAYGDVFNPDKVLAGGAYTDPATGETVAGQSSPSAAGESLGKTITDPRQFDNCLQTGWAVANPVEWVMVPVQCALQWAFAMSPDALVKAGTDITTAWNNAAPGQVIQAVGAWHISFDVSGCGGVPWEFTYKEAHGGAHQASTDLGIPSACPGTKYAAVASNVKLYSSLLVIAGTIWATLGFAGAAVGFNARPGQAVIR